MSQSHVFLVHQAPPGKRDRRARAQGVTSGENGAVFCAALQLTERLGEATGDGNTEGPELQIGKPLGTSTGVFVPLASTLL